MHKKKSPRSWTWAKDPTLRFFQISVSPRYLFTHPKQFFFLLKSSCFPPLQFYLKKAQDDPLNAQTEIFDCIDKIYAHLEFQAISMHVKLVGAGTCFPLPCVTSSLNNSLFMFSLPSFPMYWWEFLKLHASHMLSISLILSFSVHRTTLTSALAYIATTKELDTLIWHKIIISYSLQCVYRKPIVYWYL